MNKRKRTVHIKKRRKEKIMKLKTIDRKKFRVTNKVKKVSSTERFRLSISRSSKNISAQIIDDVKNITLLSSSSIEKDIKDMDKANKTEISKIVAEKLAKRAVEKKITKIYFDRGVYKYHGRVKVFAETLRKNGMEF
jgi:large subunit ribosomal protein L18